MNAPRKYWQIEQLCYCSNVHSLTSEESLYEVIGHFINAVREQRQLNEMAAGLWINAQVSRQLTSQSGKIDLLAGALKQHKIKLLTLNGFPYDNFHAAVVKERVYTPDWSTEERYQYSCQLAEILAACLPVGVIEGTISTLPLGFRHDWSAQKHGAALQALCKIAEYLAELHARTGKAIRLCLEMEPDCVLESTFETIKLFLHELPAKAKQLGINQDIIQRHLGVCFDVCHQAVMFENIQDSMTQILSTGITIGKIQISSALEVLNPAQASVQVVLQQYAEPKYLHQVRVLQNNELMGRSDLGEALADADFPAAEPWRIHFHVPIQAETLQCSELKTTQGAIFDVLDFLQANPHCHPHLEVETYTWHVLPEAMRPHDSQSLVAGLTQELNWLGQAMQARGLLQTNEHE